MKVINSVRRYSVEVLGVLCLVFVFAVVVYGQSSSASHEDLAMNLIVKISGDLGEGSANNIVGAGIIVGIEDEFVYIATADHVVRDSGKVAQNVKVQFKFWPGSSVPATLLDNHSSPQIFDLAIVRVNLAESEITSERFQENVRFRQIGYIRDIEQQLHLKDNVFPIGHPGGMEWQLALNPGKFRTMADQSTFRFEYGCEDGHSGGAVFTENWALLGMLQRQFGKDCEALSIEGMRAKLKEWGIPLNLPPLDDDDVILRPTATPVPSPPSPTPVPPSPSPIAIKPMLPVPKGEYEITPYLQQYVRNVLEKELLRNPVTITQDFSIQVGEVTVGEFRAYVESLNDEARAALGTRWKQGRDGRPYDDARPVENVTWQEAAGYARWFSEQTRSESRLPTLEQWIASCVKYAEDYPILRKTYDQPIAKLRSQIDHLLGNLREWSSSPCQNGGYRLLGENYRTKVDSIGESNCSGNARWPGVGFRLITLEK